MRVLIAEDTIISRHLLEATLRKWGYDVQVACDGVQAKDILLREDSPRLAVLDWMMPGFTGPDLCKLVRQLKREPYTYILLLTSRSLKGDLIEGMEAGADDYLAKPFAFTELLARVQALVRRSSGITEPTRLAVGDLAVNLVSREVRRADRNIELQPMEFSLLEYLMRNAGRVVSKTMIMEHVWNYDFDPQTNVVEARICRLRDKIDRDFPAKLIHTVRGVGYVLKENS